MNMYSFVVLATFNIQLNDTPSQGNVMENYDDDGMKELNLQGADENMKQDNTDRQASQEVHNVRILTSDVDTKKYLNLSFP